MGFIFGIINFVLDVYKLLIIVHVILSLLNVSAGKWTTLLSSVVEPVLKPIRRALAEKLPANWQVFDWSPVVLLLAIVLIQWIL